MRLIVFPGGFGLQLENGEVILGPNERPWTLEEVERLMDLYDAQTKYEAR